MHNLHISVCLYLKASASACATGAHVDLVARAAASLVVVSLAMDEAGGPETVQAAQSAIDEAARAHEPFVDTQEARVLQRLVNALQDGDEQTVDELLKLPLFRYAEPEVSHTPIQCL